MERPARLIELLRALARRGRAAARPVPGLRRLVLLQIDGLSSRRLEEAIARGDLPHLARRLASGQFRLERLATATAPSTPVHQAGLLYGTTLDIPGFGWHDHALGRTVRMDLADDVAAVERRLEAGSTAPGLLDGGVSYGTIFGGSARETFFNVTHWSRFGLRPPSLANAWDRLASLASAGAVAGRMAARGAAELAHAAREIGRLVARQHPLRFELRFLFFRLLFGVVLRDVAAHGIVLDLCRGIPIVFANFVAYDEVAHRRGPDSAPALAHLRQIDAAIGEVFDAAEAVPEYGYDLFIVSDHGQSATAPFERVMGDDAAAWITQRALDTGPEAAPLARALARLRALRFQAHTWPDPVGPLLDPGLAELERGVEARLREAHPGAPVDIQVVTGGTIAHVYLRSAAPPLALEEIERRWPALAPRLSSCPGIGLIVARAQAGPVVFHRGERCPIDDRRRLARFAPFRTGDGALLAHHLAAAVVSARAGDLVAFGAFAPAGNIAFDYEYGSHGGVHPDELDCFLIHPRGVPVPVGDTFRADDLHRFFRGRYGR